jgi:hypothetical protein
LFDYGVPVEAVRSEALRRAGISVMAREAAPSGRPRVAIVIPARNEAASLVGLFPRLAGRLPGCEVRTFVVDDGSADDTASVAARAGATVVRHERGLGIGAALTTGFEAARAWGPHLIVQMDADGQHDPELLPELIRPVTDGTADYVLGSRFATGAQGLSPVRRVGVRFYTALVRRLGRIAITDVTSGYRAFHSAVYERIAIRSRRNWAIEMTLRAGLNRVRTREISAPFVPRTAGRSQFDARRLFVQYHFRALVQIFRAFSSRVISPPMGLPVPAPDAEPVRLSARETARPLSLVPLDVFANRISWELRGSPPQPEVMARFETVDDRGRGRER